MPPNKSPAGHGAIAFERDAGVRRHGLGFGAGVLATFWAIAAALLALCAGGPRRGSGSGQHYGDSFAIGALAVVVATPCTAPFMGSALDYALVQHAAVGMSVLTALAAGLAARAAESAGAQDKMRARPLSSSTSTASALWGPTLRRSSSSC
jgi:hypothetical protein